KAWRVEDPNTFGTDEFIKYCRAVGAEPYLCGSPTVGDAEELSNWVEYCNQTAGRWARLRAANGSQKPFGVKFWSVGNENYGGADVGAVNSPQQFAELARSRGEMMWRVDRSIQIVVPFNNNEEWGRVLLRSARPLISALAVHIYSDELWQRNEPAPYLACMKKSLEPEVLLIKTRGVLHAIGADKMPIAIDEWNLRGWHHPRFWDPTPADIAARDRNDENQTYTCADAVYAGCFLIACQRHADRVLMANFAPIVNVRGAIYTHQQGIVLRPTYHVFDLMVNHALPIAVRTRVECGDLPVDGGKVPMIDASLTTGPKGQYALTAVNRHDRLPVEIEIRVAGAALPDTAELWTVTGPQPDSFNDVGHPADVTLRHKTIRWAGGKPLVTLPPHSVSVVRF
ncbi:MAG: alpha-N-arabinofuranosidase, partial [Planctomycetia bacterium]|nr:alpha-N-arabinofuranosidase [Planctomycetia bacterium]